MQLALIFVVLISISVALSADESGGRNHGNRHSRGQSESITNDRQSRGHQHRGEHGPGPKNLRNQHTKGPPNPVANNHQFGGHGHYSRGEPEPHGEYHRYGGHHSGNRGSNGRQHWHGVSHAEPRSDPVIEFPEIQPPAIIIQMQPVERQDPIVEAEPTPPIQ